MTKAELQQSKIGNWIQFGSLLLSATAAVLAFMAFRQTQDALALDKRPVVLIRPAVPALPADGANAQWNFGMINYGALPAIRNRLQSRILMGSNIPSDVEHFFRSLPVSLPMSDGPGSIVPPDSTADPPPAFGTAYSADKIGSEMFSRYVKAGQLTIVGRLEYSVVGGNRRYRTDFCFNLLSSGAIRICTRHNDMIDIEPEAED